MRLKEQKSIFTSKQQRILFLSKRFPSRSPRIRHQSELTKRYWENAVMGLKLRTKQGCYILCPFAHPVACYWKVAAQSLKAIKLLANEPTQQLPTILGPFARSFRHFHILVMQ